MIKTVNAGLLGSNTYVVFNESTKIAMIVDCGCKAADAIGFVNKMGLKVEYIVLTHGHFDHAHYTSEYVCAFPDAEIICHSEELKVLLDPSANLSTLFADERSYRFPYKTVEEGDMISLGKTESGANMIFKIIHSPGHTPGSICLLCEELGIMLTGDTLFNGGYGRTDFAYGSATQMRESLRRLLSLDGAVRFYPGHGIPSTISNEEQEYL